MIVVMRQGREVFTEQVDKIEMAPNGRNIILIRGIHNLGSVDLTQGSLEILPDVPERV